MWNHLEPHSAKLEEVFEPLQKRAMAFERPWSIAELKLSEKEVSWLRDWFSSLTPQNTENWIKSVMLARFPGKAYATYRQMFGALLVCVGAEVCRDESREDSVWPTIRSILPSSHALQRELFLSNGQPSCPTKDLIADAVRALNLRHAMDLEGTQQWFITIKLQYGFTYRGAKNRLAEWLVNLGRPHAVQYLNGESHCPELASESFQWLWQALLQFRRDRIGDAEVRPLLQSSPWTRSHWIDDLLREARERIETLGVGDGPDPDGESTEDANVQEEFRPVSGLSLKWAGGAIPRLCVNLDKHAIQEATQGVDANELDFYVDGAKVTRWVRQKDGTWAGNEYLYAEPESQNKLPNLAPRVLAVRSRSGDVLAEWDFSDSGLLDWVLVFDMDNSRMVKAAEEWLEPERHYAILCDRQCEIRCCTPVETFEKAGVARKAIRLPAPLTENVCVSYADFVLWQPIHAAKTQAPRSSIVLSSPMGKTLSMNDKTRLVMEGLPDDAESVNLLIHTKVYDTEWEDNGIWRTTADVTVTPEVASRQETIRVRFSSQGKKQTHTPRVSLRLLSAAVLRYLQDHNSEKLVLESLEAGAEVNRSEGTAYLRVWIPQQETTARVCEDNFQVGRARHGKIRLKEIPGHGGELRVLSGREMYSLRVRCLDRGCISAFMPSVLGMPALLSLSVPKEPGEVGPKGYAVWEWRPDKGGRAKLHCLPNGAVLPTSTERTWKLRLSGQPMAVALTWKGCWLGAWWGIDQIRAHIELRNDLSESEFAILKWLRVPILQPAIASALALKIQQNPCRFLRSWLQDAYIPEGISRHDFIDGLDFVARSFLWTQFPASHADEAVKTLTKWYGNLAHPDRCIGHLDKLVDVSPVLMWKGLELFLRRDAKGTWELLRAFTCARLGLPATCKNSSIRQRLEFLEERAAQSAGISRESLARLVDNWIRPMRQDHWHPAESDRLDLAKIGETHSGRQYVSTRMCSYWLMLSGEEGIYP